MAPKPAKKAIEPETPPENPPTETPAPGEGSAVPAADPAAEAAKLVEGSAAPDADASPPAAPGAGPPHPPSGGTDQEAPFGRFKNGVPRKAPPGEKPPRARRSPPDARLNAQQTRAEAVISAAPQIDNAGLAAMLNGTFFLITSAMLGDDGRPTMPEAETMNNTLSAYLAYKDVKPSPELALAACYCGFIVTRLTRPTVRDKAIGWWAVIKAKFSRKKPRPDLRVVETTPEATQ